MALTLKRLRGRPRRPRYQFSDEFICVCSDQHVGRPLFIVAGWSHYSAFCARLHAREVAATPIAVERFYRLADALRFPRADVFRVSR